MKGRPNEEKELAQDLVNVFFCFAVQTEVQPVPMKEESFDWQITEK